MTHDERVSVEIGREAYVTRVVAGGHEMVADEPTELGGQDRGATPYGYLLGAIGSCVAITVRMYADRKEWPLDGVRVELRHERRKPGDETIYLDLSLDGDLSDEQRERLVEIAGRCPVKRTVTGELLVETNVVG
jgi:putative redox protein